MKIRSFLVLLILCASLLCGCARALPGADHSVIRLTLTAPTDGEGGTVSIFTREKGGESILSWHEKLSPGDENIIELQENQYFTLSGDITAAPGE